MLHCGVGGSGSYAEREFLLFDGPGGAMGIGFCFWRWDLFFARKREKKLGVFFLRFLWCFCFFGGDFAFLGGDFAVLGGVFALRDHYFARSAIFFLAFSPRGAVSKT